MFNVSEEMEEYRPINLEAMEDVSDDLSEETVEAVHLYNRALEDMRTGSEDMAIIALKKAISLYPSFYEAVNLLGLCYLAAGKKEKGREVFRQVIEADDSSIKAMRYIKKLDGGEESEELAAEAYKVKKEKHKKGEKRDNLFGAWLAKGIESEDNSLYGLKYIVGILIGVLIMGLIWYLVPTNKSLFSFERVENIVKDPELEEKIEQLTERAEKLEQDLRDRREENRELSNRFDLYRNWIERLDEAEKEYKAGNSIQSAEVLEDSTREEIPEELLTRWQELWDQVRISAAEELYKEGNRIYNGNATKNTAVYAQALEQYERALAYLGEDRESYLAALYYQAGKAAARSDAMERAVELFETLKQDFTDSQYSSYAASRLREIESGNPIQGN